MTLVPHYIITTTIITTITTIITTTITTVTAIITTTVWCITEASVGGRCQSRIGLTGVSHRPNRQLLAFFKPKKLGNYY